MQILLYIFFILVRLQWQQSPALCISTTLQRLLSGVCQVIHQQSPSVLTKSNHPCGSGGSGGAWSTIIPISLVHPFLGLFLVTHPIALDSVGQTGLRDELQMDSRSLWRSAATGFDSGSDLGLLVWLWEGNKASMAFPAHCFTGGCQMF